MCEISPGRILNSFYLKVTFIVYMLFTKLRFGWMKSINTYLRLKINVVLGKFFNQVNFCKIKM
jgi:hypothetical protein